MAIIVEYSSKEERNTPNYPKLMETQDGDIFYMVRENYGLPLTGDGWDFDGDFANFSGTKYKFSDYNEPITIQNKFSDE